MRYVIAYLTGLAAFLVVDIIWIGFVAFEFFQAQIGEFLRDEFLLLPALGFYLLYVAGTIALAVAPALREDRWQGAAWRGAVLGFCAYGTYDLTNLATIEGWPVMMAVVDIPWGTALTAIVAVAGYAGAKRFGRSASA